MKSGYQIIHDTFINPNDTILEVINWEGENVIQFYSWDDNDEIENLKSTIGIWKIKKLKND